MAALVLLLLLVTTLAGPVTLLVAAATAAVLLGARSWRRARARHRTLEADFGTRAWSTEDLRTLAVFDPVMTAFADPVPAAAGPDRKRHVLDRWTWTQVLWAGVAGWMYNELARLAERLVAGSSYAFVRRPALALVNRVLASLSGHAVRRTIATSALLTASTTGLWVATVGTAGSPAVTASPAAVFTADLQPATTTYTVQPGDTLWAIAQRFGTTVDALAAANSIADPDLIYPGQVLVIGSAPTPGAPTSPGTTSTTPAPATYTVQPGDTLSAIAAQFGTTVAALVAANAIADPDLIYPGQVLVVTTGSAPTAPSPVSPAPPTPATYTVQPGDTLSAIAAQFGTTVAALVAANAIADPDLIYPGQVLVIAAGSAPGVPTQVTAPAPPGVAGYENPLRAISGLTPERIDQGVDYAGSGPIYAIGNGVVLNTTNAGWPGGAFISYQLSDGPAAGDIVYVAENVEPAVSVGQQVDPSTVLGTLIDAYPNLETGWAAPPGNGDSAAMESGQWSAYDGANSLPSAYGENFSELLAALGAPPGLSEGPVQGSLPAGWPSW